MPIKPVDQWSVDDVCTWLSAIGMGTQAKAFHDNGVDGSLLTSMSSDDMTNDLGLDSFQAEKVLHEIDFANQLSTSSGGGASSGGGSSVSTRSANISACRRGRGASKVAFLLWINAPVKSCF